MTGKSLVVFYSRTGTTKRVAESISNLLKCDVEEVIDTKSRNNTFALHIMGEHSNSPELLCLYTESSLS